MRSVRVDRLRHRFVGEIPDKLVPGELYVSLEHSTAAHSCCCGCGSEVVTPLSPAYWQMGFDGEEVSLTPSIGNWSYDCRSHYFITRGRVEWAGTFNDGEVEAVRERNAGIRERHYGHAVGPPPGGLLRRLAAAARRAGAAVLGRPAH